MVVCVSHLSSHFRSSDLKSSGEFPVHIMSYPSTADPVHSAMLRAAAAKRNPLVMKPDLMMQPDVMQPDVMKPDVMKQPDVMTQPYVMKPDVMMQPDVMTQPDVVKQPDVMTPDDLKLTTEHVEKLMPERLEKLMPERLEKLRREHFEKLSRRNRNLPKEHVEKLMKEPDVMTPDVMRQPVTYAEVVNLPKEPDVMTPDVMRQPDVMKQPDVMTQPYEKGRWYYVDSDGIEWGTWDSITLRGWWTQGVLDANVMVREKSWTSHRPLGTLFTPLPQEQLDIELAAWEPTGPLKRKIEQLKAEEEASRLQVEQGRALFLHDLVSANDRQDFEDSQTDVSDDWCVVSANDRQDFEDSQMTEELPQDFVTDSEDSQIE